MAAGSGAGLVNIRASGLSVAYDSFVAVRCQSLNISGRILAVIGHNGAGKSTLIKALLGLLPRTGGTLDVFSGPDSSASRLVPERHMAFCPEGGAVFADISVESYVRMWCRFKHGDADYYKKAGAPFVEMLKIGPLLRRRGVELSKGQRRRVQTVIGFLCNPALFLLDEPFDGLDVLKTHELAEIIDQHSGRMSFVLSSHRMDVVERLADSFIVLRGGEVFSSGSLEHVCGEMAGQSYRIEAPGNPEQSVQNLKSRFPSLLINHIGEQIVITGMDIVPAQLCAFLKETGAPDISLVRARTSLVEAMNYHLRQIERLG